MKLITKSFVILMLNLLPFYALSQAVNQETQYTLKPASSTNFIQLMTNDVISMIVISAFLFGFVFLLINFYKQKRQFLGLMKQNQRLAKEKEQAEKNNGNKDEFLANMSHEIRNPLNAIVGMSHLLSESDLNPSQQELNNTLNTSAASLLVIINDILDLSKVEANCLELESSSFNIRNVINTISKQTEVLINKKDVKINITLDDALPEILTGDAVRFGQILFNIMNNAAKFTAQGAIDISGKILIKTEHNIKIQFSVADTGIGITSHQQKRLFYAYDQAEKSTSRKYGGTGLGLTISKKLCQLMGGKIWMESRDGGGSCFHFTVGFQYTAKEMMEEPPQFKEPIANELSILENKKVLLVDDNQINLTIAKSILTNAGIEVETVVNGKLAVEAIEKSIFDAVLMDVQMPVMSGIEATNHIRNVLKLKHLPIIAVSANAMKSDIEKTIASGMNAHVAKPIRIEVLLSTLAKQIGNEVELKKVS